MSGKEVILFHEVVADYFADIVARMGAGGGETAAQIRRAALNNIKGDLDDPTLPYSGLGLPETLALRKRTQHVGVINFFFPSFIIIIDVH